MELAGRIEQAEGEGNPGNSSTLSRRIECAIRSDRVSLVGTGMRAKQITSPLEFIEKAEKQCVITSEEVNLNTGIWPESG